MIGAAAFLSDLSHIVEAMFDDAARPDAVHSAPALPWAVRSYDFAAWADELDSEKEAAFIRDCESAPVRPELIGQLASIHPADVDGDARIGLAICWARVRAYADAMLASVVAAEVQAAPAAVGPH